MKTTLSEMETINPLITRTGESYRVSAALTALADLIMVEQTMEPAEDQGLGIAFILQTCAVALIQMQRAKS
ncbi:MAG: hypothetical protein ABTQ26_11885 [Azonexus sp.]